MEVEAELCDKWKSRMIQRKTNWQSPPAVVEEVRGIEGSYRPPLKITVKLDAQDVCMNLDTGISVSIMSETKSKQLWPGRSLSPSQIKLQTYSKEHLVA